MDIFKLLKTLNSAQSSWQITLAIVLGMMSGFLPLFTPLNFVIFFVAFTINIPLGVFFFMSVIFASLGLLLDPIFASLGYSVLTDPSLNAIFTQMYNSTPMLWTSYNYTILMGSFLVSLILILPMFFILNPLINKYRDVLEAKFKNSKYFSWLNPYSQKNLKKKPGLLRLWAAGLFIVLVALISAILLLIIDPVIKYTLEYTLSKATNRTVYIDSVDTKVFQTSIKLSNISILSKDKDDSDDISIDTVTIKLNTEHLLEKKYDFEIISFGNITLNTKVAKKDETPVTKSVSSAVSNAKNYVKSIKKPALPSPNELIAKEGLASLKAAKEIKTNIKAIEQKWAKVAKGEKQKEEIASLKKQVKDLEAKAKNIKNLSQITAILKSADKLKKDIKTIQKEMKALNDDYKKDKKLIQKYISEIKTLPLQDYNHLKNKYSFDQNGAMNLIGTYFSSSLEKYLRMGTKYYAMIKPYISSGDKKDEEQIAQERMKGKWIKYAREVGYPDFVIRKLNANIIKNSYNFDVKIKDISDNQKLYAKPILGTIRSKSDKYKLFKVDLEHNELGKKVLTTINSKAEKFQLAHYQPMAKLSMNKSIINEKSLIKITDYKSVNAKIDIDFLKTQLSYLSSGSSTDKIIGSILGDINSFIIDSSIGGTIKNPKISLKSDIDAKLKKGLKAQLSKQVKKYKEKLKVAINREFKKQLGDIDLGQFNDVEKILDGSLKDSSSLEKMLKKSVSKEAMQKKLKSEGIKKLESKGLDKLKSKLKLW